MAALPDLLKWSVQNSEASRQNAETPIASPPSAAMAALFGFNVGSDAERMAENLLIIKNAVGDIDLDTRIQAFEDFRLMVENLDNANNLQNIQQYKDGPRGLWTPLLEQLDSEDTEIRSLAASCCHAAVQNDIKVQEKFLTVGGIPALVRLATTDPSKDVRKRAIRALNSAAQNYQAALDDIIAHLPDTHKPKEKIDAADADSLLSWRTGLESQLL
ncbi:Hsp70 nucleotide exchange factor FES1 [Lophium mytilinum]|uniref:Hsp70 nucleotide exchange factor FES1 n=1 Tax=Lophium mytilinum TaxID=390894 RepID=A0A6A6QIJ9_9PEZI|nr:Hsp70 nucleotide exchange factor FES1 [Lophium mytilinum]